MQKKWQWLITVYYYSEVQRLAKHCLFSMALDIHRCPAASSLCRNMWEVCISFLFSGQNVVQAQITCQCVMDAAVSIETAELQSVIWLKPRWRVGFSDQLTIRESHHYVRCLLYVVGSHLLSSFPSSALSLPVPWPRVCSLCLFYTMMSFSLVYPLAFLVSLSLLPPALTQGIC